MSIEFIGMGEIVTGPAYNSANYTNPLPVPVPDGMPGDVIVLNVNGSAWPSEGEYANWRRVGSFWAKITTTKSETLTLKNSYVYYTMVSRWRSPYGFNLTTLFGPPIVYDWWETGNQWLEVDSGWSPSTRIIVATFASETTLGAYSNGFVIRGNKTQGGGNVSVQSLLRTTPVTNLYCSTPYPDVSGVVYSCELRDASLLPRKRRYGYLPVERTGADAYPNENIDYSLYVDSPSLPTVTGATVQDFGMGSAKLDSSYTTETKVSTTSNRMYRKGFLYFFEPFIDPGFSTNHVVRVRIRGNNASGDAAEVGLYEFLRPIAIRRIAVTNTFATYSFTLTDKEANSITNYGNLGVRVKAIV